MNVDQETFTSLKEAAFDAAIRIRAIDDELAERRTPLDIQKGLNDWRTINLDPHKWATFEAIQFVHERVVRVSWGIIHSNGLKEMALQTITFFLEKDGEVREYAHTHF
jgi:hypothetical protein